MKKYLVLIVALLCIYPAISQESSFGDAIEDNSFFLEEAYNQEVGVVQFIFNSQFMQDFKVIEATLTNEWSVWGQDHQFSFTLPFSSYSLTNLSISGFRDLMLNYRYQVPIGNPNLAFAPRFSLIVPTGEKGFSNDVVGFEGNLPLSIRFHEKFTSHFNLGYSLTPNIGIENYKYDINKFFVGGSIIYLLDRRFNLMLEALYYNINMSQQNKNSGISDISESSILINPGCRFSIPVGSLEIVPGLSVPIVIPEEGDPETGLFLYLSFEFPYK